MYDLLLVGAGITSATICACLKHKYKILVIDVRDHIAGNCYDYQSGGSMIHKYGPHIFHTAEQDVIDLLSKYTEWIPYKHKVSAELEDGLRVPFPYSKETSIKLGKELSENEIIDIFFKPYSKKMWGVEWDKLSPIIKNRVPKNTNITSDYFINQFTAFPKLGYTKMIENMFNGVDIILGANRDAWQSIKAKKIVYCGRPDHIKLKNGLRIGNISGDWLSYRNVDFKLVPEKWDSDAPVVNFCHLKTPYTRKTFLPLVLGGTSELVTYETPSQACVGDIAPFYPYPSEDNIARYKTIKNIISEEFPNIILGGRLGFNSYIDLDIASKNGIRLSKNL